MSFNVMTQPTIEFFICRPDWFGRSFRKEKKRQILFYGEESGGRGQVL